MTKSIVISIPFLFVSCKTVVKHFFIYFGMSLEFICELSLLGQVFNGLTTDISLSVVHQFDTGLAIRLNNVGFYIWEAFFAFDYNSIVSWSFYVVFLNQRTSRKRGVVADNFNTIHVRLLNSIFENNGVFGCVEQFNSCMVDLHFVHCNEGLYLRVNDDTWTLTYHENIVQNEWLRALALDVKACLLTTYHGVVSENK